MAMTDPVADYLARLRNATRAKHKYVDVPASRVKAQMSKLLLDAGIERV
jgi:small subunit ribosomal protein S8